MDRRTFLSGFTLAVPGVARMGEEMPDYVTRSEFDQLLQQLRSEPGAGNMPAFRSIPQILKRNGVAQLAQSDGGWQTFYTYEGVGNLLYPDRAIDLSMVCGLHNFSGGSAGVEWRVQVNAVTILDGPAISNVMDGTDDNGLLHFRLQQLASGSQLVYIDHRPGGAVFYDELIAIDLASPWSLTVDTRWSIPDPGLLTLTFSHLHSLLMLL